MQKLHHCQPAARATSASSLVAPTTGLAFVPMMGAVLPVNLVAPRLAERFGAPAVIAAGAFIAAAGCAALLVIKSGTSYLAICGQLVAMGGGLGLLVPPLTSSLLGSVEKARSGIAAGVLNSTRQTGSVLGVALFGSLLGQSDTFVAGTDEALIISTAVLLIAGTVILSEAVPRTLKGRGANLRAKLGFR